MAKSPAPVKPSTLGKASGASGFGQFDTMKELDAELALMTVRRANLQKRRDDAAFKKARGW